MEIVCPTPPKWSFWRFWDRTWDPFWKSKIFFSVNLTYSCSLLAWNSPGITFSLESFHNYSKITVKSRKNDGNLGVFYFWLWFRNNYGISTTLSSHNVGEVSAVWRVLISLTREIFRMFVTRNIVIIRYCKLLKHAEYKEYNENFPTTFVEC